MLKEEKINALAQMFRSEAYEFEIENFIKANAKDDDDAKDITEKAKEIVLQEKLKHLPKRNLMIFSAWTIGVIISFYLFYSIIPYQDVIGYTTLLSIIGALVVCFFILHAYAYYGTWTVDFLKELDKPNIQYSFAIIFLIPCFILAFLFSEKFDYAENELLQSSKIQTIGTVISGNSTEYKRVLHGGTGMKTNKVNVKFVTKEGKEFIITKEIDGYNYSRKFYKGLEVDVIYSKNNPKNMQLINLESLPELPVDFDNIYPH
ncbi:hypothetical protein DBR40_19055 [Pedobacter sp. KBW01]|uniref:hypothetical protein n=1 Tax=Pedobacter sp. KBW01 TaxID=2153364 RepID=UPI000F5B8020|nr:hypothetical protein [Pedobacter sp. KBW01]RQO69076.1 hypothetical protein DBR40_19055 [Pedobacter sp. KBW01]